MAPEHRYEVESSMRHRPVELTDDTLTQVAGGVQKVREAATDDELIVVVSGESISVNF